MSYNLRLSLLSLRVSATVVHTCAIVLTSWRLWYKIFRRRWWQWEDLWAAVALVAIIISEASVWIYTEPSPGSIPGNGPIVAYWFIMLNFTIGLWSSRLSIICSIIRLSPPTKVRTVAFCTAAAFAAVLVALLVQKSWFCVQHDDWKKVSPLSCPLHSSVGFTQLVTDFLSDMALVVLPVYILHQVKLPRDQRIMILSVFSASLLTTLLSIVHAVFFIKADAIFKTLTGQLELAFCAIVSNLLLVVICVFDRWRRRSDNCAALLTTVVDFPTLDETREQKSIV